MQTELITKAAGWGFISASSLVIGAIAGYWLPLSKKIIASLMAYGSGVLIAALCFSQIPEAHELGGTTITIIGLLIGGSVFIIASKSIEYVEKHQRQQRGANHSNVAILLALGALLDGIPESLSLGIGLIEGGQVSFVLLVAIFLSNLPEGLGSAAEMKNEGKSATQVFSMWGGIVLLCVLSAIAGPALFSGLSRPALAFISAFSAGAVLCMIVDTMLPEAFETTHEWTGMITLLGFITAFALQHSSHG